jgi:hypothetical protein
MASPGNRSNQYPRLPAIDDEPHKTSMNNRIGVARFDLPEHLPPGAAADLPEEGHNAPDVENTKL